MRQLRQGFGARGRPRNRRDQNYGTAKDAKSAKGVPDEAFRKNARSAIWI
jgi:hypothetical protein